MKTENPTLNWIIEHKEILSIAKIERTLKMPEGTLHKAVKGTRELPKKWKTVLDNYIEENLHQP